MDPHYLFSLSGPIAMAGWVVLAISPLIPVWSQRISTLIIPLLLSVAYTALVLANWADAPGGFGSLADVMLLFTVPEIALAGWLHYLAFDLFVGAWEVRVARRESIPHLLVLPCLVFTFLFGPAGFLLFMIIRYSLQLTRGGVRHA